MESNNNGCSSGCLKTSLTILICVIVLILLLKLSLPFIAGILIYFNS